MKNISETEEEKAKKAEDNGWQDVHGGPPAGAYWRGVNPVTKKMEAIPDNQMRAAGVDLLPLVSAWVNAGVNLRESHEALSEVMLCSPEAPFMEAAWASFQGYTAMLARTMNDHNKWLEWFHHECALGDKPMTMSFANGEELLVVGAQDLIDVIVCDNEGNRIR